MILHARPIQYKDANEDRSEFDAPEFGARLYTIAMDSPGVVSRAGK